MANKGLVMDLPYGGERCYLLMPRLIGFMEFTFMRRRADLPMERLARLLSDYLREQGRGGQAEELFGSRHPLARTLFDSEHIPVSSRITPYEDAQQIIRDSSYRAGYRIPPRNAVSFFTRILWEKGRLMPFVVKGLKRRRRLPPLRRKGSRRASRRRQ